VARLDETPAQCEERYGKHIGAIPGAGDVAFTRVYTNGGFAIIACFVAKPAASPVVGCIAYRVTPAGRSPRIAFYKDALLATVPGRWRSYEESFGRIGKPERKPAFSVGTSQVLHDRNERCMAALSFGVHWMFGGRVPSPYYASLTPIGSAGGRAFAYWTPAGPPIREPEFLVIASFDGALALETARDALVKPIPTPVPPREPPPGL
jgi:hypothetical protein